MGRKGKHTREEFRELALSEMEAHLEASPAENLSLRNLSKRIGYSPGMLISVFGSQSLFLLEVNSRTLDEMTDHLNSKGGGGTLRDNLYRIAEGYLEFAEQNRYRWKMVFEHKMAEGEPVPDWMQNKIDTLFANLSHSIFPGSETPSNEQADLMAKTLWASVHGITQLSLDDKLFIDAGMDGKSMIKVLVDNFCAGINKNIAEK